MAVELAERLCKLLEPGHDISPKDLADVLRPGPENQIPNAEAVAKLVRSDRTTLEESLETILVSDQISHVLQDVERGAIERELNRPFPARAAITVEFLDLVVRRQQELERLVRFLSGVVLEITFPLESERKSVCQSSTNRTTHLFPNSLPE